MITATFVGYLVAGFWGLPRKHCWNFPSVILHRANSAAPIVARHRANPNLQGFIKGAYAAAIGTILGACVLLGKIAIGDWLTALIGIVSLAVLFRWKVSNPLLIAVTAAIGLIAFPILQPGLGDGALKIEAVLPRWVRAGHNLQYLNGRVFDRKAAISRRDCRRKLPDSGFDPDQPSRLHCRH